MANYINKYADMTAYNADSTKQYPNTAKVESENRVLFRRSDPDAKFVICKYNVSSTSSATKLLGGATGITKQIIDGVEQSSVVATYTFNTKGEHVVKYEFANNQIGKEAFFGCINLTSVTIGNSVTTIGNSAFEGCINLTSITITDSVTTIGKWAFGGCSSLTSVTIPNNVTSIGQYAFYTCDSLTSITIPNSVTSIDYNAFNGCSSLTNVTVEASTPPTLGSNAFANNASGRKIYVPAASVNTYKTASNWSTYASDIEAIQ